MDKKQMSIFIGILIIIISTFVMINNIGPKKGASNDTPEKTNTVSNKVESKPIKSKEEVLKEKEKNEQAYLEQGEKNNSLYNEASDDLNVEKCNQITGDTLLQTNCKDNIYLGLSSEKNEMSYCMKISSKEKMNNCKNLIYYNYSIVNNSNSYCTKIKGDDTLLNNCNKNFIFQTIETTNQNGDTKICDSLKDADKEYCINRIKKSDDLVKLRDVMEGTQNSELCSSIADLELRNHCNDSVYSEQAINEKNISLCDKIINPTKKTECRDVVSKIIGTEQFKVAVSKNDLKLCQVITNNELKNKCVDSISSTQAIQTRNISLCENITSKNLKDQCKSDLTVLLKQK